MMYEVIHVWCGTFLTCIWCV